MKRKKSMEMLAMKFQMQFRSKVANVLVVMGIRLTLFFQVLKPGILIKSEERKKAAKLKVCGL